MKVLLGLMYWLSSEYSIGEIFSGSISVLVVSLLGPLSWLAPGSLSHGCAHLITARPALQHQQPHSL